MTISNIMIFSGNANPNLALKTVEFLNMPLGKITAGKFSDGEVIVATVCQFLILGRNHLDLVGHCWRWEAEPANSASTPEITA